MVLYKLKAFQLRKIASPMVHIQLNEITNSLLSQKGKYICMRNYSNVYNVRYSTDEQELNTI